MEIYQCRNVSLPICINIARSLEIDHWTKIYPWSRPWLKILHSRATVSCNYNDVIMDAMASQITSLTSVYSIVYSGVDQRKYQSSTSLAFVLGIHRWPVNSPLKWPATRKLFPFEDVMVLWIISSIHAWCYNIHGGVSLHLVSSPNDFSWAKGTTYWLAMTVA